MNKQEIEALFPITVMVDQGMIDRGRRDLYNGESCIGAIALKAALLEQDILVLRGVIWGVTNGGIFVDQDRTKVLIKTKEDVNFMRLDKPMEVTFMVRANQYE